MDEYRISSTIVTETGGYRAGGQRYRGHRGELRRRFWFFSWWWPVGPWRDTREQAIKDIEVENAIRTPGFDYYKFQVVKDEK